MGHGHVLRDDGRVSKYSLRVFLNGMDEQPRPFTGGVSIFHVPLGVDLLLKSGARAAVPLTLKEVVRRVVVELNKREEGSASRALNSKVS